MAIRTDTNPHRMDLNPEFQDILRRNGLQAHVVTTGGSLTLAVQGHDSPLLTYPITQQQARALTDWGTNSANRKAYDTLTSLIGGDFDLPRSFVNARNANGRVAMGLHGYRIGSGEYGRIMPAAITGLGIGFGPRFLGWTPRQQAGYHLRNAGGRPFLQNGAPIVPDRPDGRLKPGELRAGTYGFYYKGDNAARQSQPVDVLKELTAVITPVRTEPRPQTPATPYRDLIASDVYFTSVKWQEVLKTHGLIIDSSARTLTIQSEATRVDYTYDLTDAELAVLTSNSISEHSVRDRIILLNDILSQDFRDVLTMDRLNSTGRIGLAPYGEGEGQRQTRTPAQADAQLLASRNFDEQMHAGDGQMEMHQGR